MDWLEEKKPSPWRGTARYLVPVKEQGGQPFFGDTPIHGKCSARANTLLGTGVNPSRSQGRNPWECAFTGAFVTAYYILFLPHLNLCIKK